MFFDEKPLPGSRLMIGNTVVWENPSGLGHIGIKLRKQIWEEKLCLQMDWRCDRRDYREWIANRYDDEPSRWGIDVDESDYEILRTFVRRGEAALD